MLSFMLFMSVEEFLNYWVWKFYIYFFVVLYIIFVVNCLIVLIEREIFKVCYVIVLVLFSFLKVFNLLVYSIFFLVLFELIKVLIVLLCF